MLGNGHLPVLSFPRPPPPREEARQVWEKREEEWERERKARERLMAEVRARLWGGAALPKQGGAGLCSALPLFGSKQVLAEREQQIQQKMERNRQAQQESVRVREQLIQQLEAAWQLTQREQEAEAERKTARKEEQQAQVGPPC